MTRTEKAAICILSQFTEDCERKVYAYAYHKKDGSCDVLTFYVTKNEEKTVIYDGKGHLTLSYVPEGEDYGIIYNPQGEFLAKFNKNNECFSGYTRGAKTRINGRTKGKMAMIYDSETFDYSDFEILNEPKEINHKTEKEI